MCQLTETVAWSGLFQGTQKAGQFKRARDPCPLIACPASAVGVRADNFNTCIYYTFAAWDCGTIPAMNIGKHEGITLSSVAPSALGTLDGIIAHPCRERSSGMSPKPVQHKMKNFAQTKLKG